MSRREVRWERMFPDELERAFAECPLVYFPYGLCEPGPHFAMGPSAVQSDRRTGERIAADESHWLAANGRELLAAYVLEKPSRRLRTFAGVESLWADVVTPRVPLFETMQMWEGDEPPAEGSVWRANWPIPTLPIADAQGEAE